MNKVHKLNEIMQFLNDNGYKFYEENGSISVGLNQMTSKHLKEYNELTYNLNANRL